MQLIKIAHSHASGVFLHVQLAVIVHLQAAISKREEALRLKLSNFFLNKVLSLSQLYDFLIL